MNLSPGTYYLICFSQLHSGDLDDWEETAKTPEEAMKIIDKTMKSRAKETWSGEAEDEIDYIVYHVNVKLVNLKKETKVIAKIKGR